MKIACLTTRLTRPSYRFRIEQLRPCFEACGHTVTPVIVPRSLSGRLRCLSGLSQYDAVISQQMTFGLLSFTLLRRSARTLIYDIDDAVYLKSSGEPDRSRHRRFRRMVRGADLVVCGNGHLADSAGTYTDKVKVLSTAVDTQRFSIRRGRSVAETVTIIWTGSRSTSVYLREMMPVLDELPAPVRLKVISDRVDPEVRDYPSRIGREFVQWSPIAEVAELATGNIGLMPMPDTPWTRGKCGCKALQYMSLAIPAVCSPVGVNREIIQHGQTGFLAENPVQWRDTLSALVSNPDLRSTVGMAGRRLVEQKYSISHIGPMYVDAVVAAATRPRRLRAA